MMSNLKKRGKIGVIIQLYPFVAIIDDVKTLSNKITKESIEL